MNNHSNSQQSLNTLLQAGQLLAIIVGFAVIAFQAGRRDTQIDNNSQAIKELRSIASDLVRVSTQSIRNEMDIAKIEARILNLERRYPPQ